MAIKAVHKKTKFGVGDTVGVTQSIKEGDKKRDQTFEGVVIGIKGRGKGRTFTVRRIGTGQIGIERIFPLVSPTIRSIKVIKRGTRGVRRAKLYYIRGKSKKEIEEIYKKTSEKERIRQVEKKIPKKRVRKNAAKKK